MGEIADDCEDLAMDEYFRNRDDPEWCWETFGDWRGPDEFLDESPFADSRFNSRFKDMFG